MNEYTVKRLKEITNDGPVTVAQLKLQDNQVKENAEVKQITEDRFLVNGDKVNIDDIKSVTINPEHFTTPERLIYKLIAERNKYESVVDMTQESEIIIDTFDEAIGVICEDQELDAFVVEKLVYA